MPDQAKGGLAWTIEGAPVIFGILNITEDSFSDGGRYLEAPAAIAHADRLLDSGAHIVDVGPAASSVGGSAIELWLSSADGFWPSSRPSNLGCPRLCRGAQSGLERQSGFV
jgi:hypothetical protein